MLHYVRPSRVTRRFGILYSGSFPGILSKKRALIIYLQGESYGESAVRDTRDETREEEGRGGRRGIQITTKKLLVLKNY